MRKCLFTGKTLDQTVKCEHTIPRSIGGRVRSSIVSSSEFNQKCGEKFDTHVAKLYQEVMTTLSPILSSEFRTGSTEFEMPGRPGRWRFNEFGRPTLCRPVPTQRDSKNVPTSFMGPTVDSLRRMASSMKKESVGIKTVLTHIGTADFGKRSAIDWHIEVSILKSILLTFDHFLEGENASFTRSERLCKLRSFIERVVSEDKLDDLEYFSEVTLGLQYETIYLDRMQRILSAARVTMPPFGHALIVSADKAQRTFDAIFWAFNSEPYAFRLSRCWSEEGFTSVVVNDICRGGQVIGPLSVAETNTLGIPNARRSILPSSFSQRDKENVANDVFNMRRSLLQKATDYVERNCDDFVIETFVTNAKLNEFGDKTVSSAIFRHLIGLYFIRLEEPNSQDAFVNIVAEHLDKDWSDEVHEDGSVTGDWDKWLGRYRDCLTSLETDFGLPGDLFPIGAPTFGE